MGLNHPTALTMVLCLLRSGEHVQQKQTGVRRLGSEEEESSDRTECEFGC